MSTISAIGTNVSTTGGSISLSSTFPELTDGTETWRLIADDDEAFNWQHTLTPTGFNGTEDVDYYTPQEIE